VYAKSSVWSCEIGGSYTYIIMKICKDGRIWGQKNNNTHLGSLLKVNCNLGQRGKYIRSVECNKRMSEQKIGKNYRFNYKHSEETKRKQRFAHKANPTKHKIDCTCPWCRAKRGETRGKDNVMYGKVSSPNKCRRYKGCWFEVPNQGKVWLRSSYELIFATYLVTKQVDFRYEIKRFILNAKTFLPDFYLVKEDKFIEVKGWMKPSDLQKLREMKEFYPNIQVDIIGGKEIDKIKKEAQRE